MSYDMVLVYIHFRRHEQYLNLIKYLAPTRRIGILHVDIGSAAVAKTARTDAEFLERCVKLGATMVEGNVATKLLVLPLLNHQETVEKTAAAIQGSIHYNQSVILVNGPTAGIPFLQQQIDLFGRPVILVQDKECFGLLEPETLDVVRETGCEVIEVGSPHQRYRVFENFKTDYLVAYPSTVTIKDYRELYDILRAFNDAVDRLPASAVIYTKVHNVRDEGNYLSDIGFFRALRLPRSVLKSLRNLCDAFVSLRLGKRRVLDLLPLGIIWKMFWLQNACVFSRTKDVLAEYPGFGIEHFIPGVRLGVITGLGSTMWETAFQRVPIELINTQDPNKLHSNYQLLREFFRYDSWKGFVTEEAYNRISPSARAGDLMKTMNALIDQAVPKATILK